MTGEHAADPADPDSRAADDQPHEHTHHHRRSRWRWGTPVVVLLCGALFVVSAIDSGGTDLRPGRYTDLASLVEAESADYEDMADRRRALEDEVERLTDEVETYEVRRARGIVDNLRDPAGLVPHRGPGISVTMSDAPEDVFAQAVEEVEAGSKRKLGELVVHQQDIQAVVNALWRGGADAVTIEGQRVVSTTGIKCEGNAVQLQGIPYPQPYEIQAVGDPELLSAALDADPLVAGFRADAEDPSIAIGWSLQTEDEVDAPAYDGLLDRRYAEPLL